MFTTSLPIGYANSEWDTFYSNLKLFHFLETVHLSLPLSTRWQPQRETQGVDDHPSSHTKIILTLLQHLPLSTRDISLQFYIDARSYTQLKGDFRMIDFANLRQAVSALANLRFVRLKFSSKYIRVLDPPPRCIRKLRQCIPQLRFARGTHHFHRHV